MTWPAVVLAALNVAQVCVLAYIAMRQAEVKRDLNDYNGTTVAHLEDVRRGIDDLSSAVRIPGARKFPVD